MFKVSGTKGEIVFVSEASAFLMNNIEDMYFTSDRAADIIETYKTVIRTTVPIGERLPGLRCREETGMEKKRTVWKKLFLSTLSLSTFTFGGGYVIISLMKTKFVDQLHWIDEDEMLDMTAIAQSSPGAIAVNGAVVVGYKLAGIPGVLIAVLGAILPPMVILSIVSLCYDAFISNPVIAAMLKGMESGIGAVIASVVWDMAAGIVKQKSIFSVAVMAGSFLACMVWKVNVVLIILAVAVLGVIRTLWTEKRGNRR